MRSGNLLLVVLFLSVSYQFAFAQEVDFEGNWFKEIGRNDDYYTRFEFRNYTKDDVVGAKKRYFLINENPFINEWEGVYGSGSESGASEFQWNSGGGFIFFHVYHTLSFLDFGTASDELGSVLFLSEKSKIIKRNSIFTGLLVKVKVGEKHFLVPENRLQDFAERVVGLSASISDFGYYLYKLDETKLKVSGLPVLPEKYRKFLRMPIKTEIKRIGFRKLNQDKFEDGTINSEEIHRLVILGAVENEKIRTGMNFFIEELGEWVEITKVMQNSSVGFIRRSLDQETRQEVCHNSEGGSGQIIPCRTIKVGMKAITKASELYF